MEKSDDRTLKLRAWKHRKKTLKLETSFWIAKMQHVFLNYYLIKKKNHFVKTSYWFLTSSSVHSSGTEGLPHNRFTDVGSNKQGNAWTKTIALLEQLIQQQHNQPSHKQLERNVTVRVIWDCYGDLPCLESFEYRLQQTHYVFCFYI